MVVRNSECMVVRNSECMAVKGNNGEFYCHKNKFPYGIAFSISTTIIIT